MDDAESLAGRAMKPPQRALALWAHPSLSRVVQLWPGASRWHRSKKQYNKTETSAARQAALIAVADKARDLQWQLDRLGIVLGRIPWKLVHCIPGSTSQQRRQRF